MFERPTLGGRMPCDDGMPATQDADGGQPSFKHLSTYQVLAAPPARTLGTGMPLPVCAEPEACRPTD